MTEEYKRNVLDYITGNVSPGNQTENSFRSNETIQNNLTTRLTALGITPINFTSNILYKDDNSNFIMYNKYLKNSKTYSFIAIFNQKGEILDILTTYDSGYLIEPIDDLNYDENGYIYGVDKPNDQDYYRIIQLNNIAIPIGNNYKCKLRSSYYIRTDFSIPSGFANTIITKLPGEARYYLFGYSTSPHKTKLIEFSNIVGLPIEWNYYEGRNLESSNPVQAKMIITSSGETNTVDIYYRMLGILGLDHEQFDGTSLTLKTQIALDNIPQDIQIESQNVVYVASRKNNNNGTYTLYIYKSNNNSVSTVLSYNVAVSGSIPSIFILVKNGMLFYKSEVFAGNSIYSIICGVYFGGTHIQSPAYEYASSDFLSTTCNVQKIYSLYSFFVLTKNEAHLPKIVIYDNQYSGSSYKSYNSTVPQYAELYSGGYIQFARNLYNRQLFYNQCVSVVNVPYNFLNDMNITPTNLLSETMSEIVSYRNVINKNKYENLFINFINKINVLDFDTDTLYPQTAVYVNNNINTGTQTNYNNTFVGKVRINFPTPTTQDITWTWIANHYETEITITVGNNLPTSIDFLSKDGTTIYITKELNLQKNKTYKLNQKLFFGNSISLENLQYDNININYQGQPLMVYIKE